jgi:hypothetical protein
MFTALGCGLVVIMLNYLGLLPAATLRTPICCSAWAHDRGLRPLDAVPLRIAGV